MKNSSQKMKWLWRKYVLKMLTKSMKKSIKEFKVVVYKHRNLPNMNFFAYIFLCFFLII